MSSLRTSSWRTGVVLAGFGCLLGLGNAEAAEPFRPDGQFGFDRLVAEVQVAPDLRAAKREVAIRDAARQQARLWPNPSVDATWGTIPIGRTNPRNLDSPLARIPNYRFGVSYTIPLGKRGPLQAVRDAEYESAEAHRCAVGRELALQLARILGAMARVELRVAALSSLVDAAAEQQRTVEARERMQMASGLEVDRAFIERGRLEQQLRTAECDLAEQEAECSAMVGRPCRSFENDLEARRFLESWSAVDPRARPATADLDKRPDLRALAASERAAMHEQTYYRRHSIPDPTVRVGYIHDQFVISGSQPSSLELTLAFPVPLFDWGQAGARAAGAAADGFAAERRARSQTTQAVLPALVDRWAAQRKRRQQLLEVLIPKAQAALSSVERAYETRLLSISDVIQARRTLLDLLLEDVDGLADAYSASLSVRMHLAERTNEGCPDPSRK
jgi:outer membrane protein, heavy metal efflux system